MLTDDDRDYSDDDFPGEPVDDGEMPDVCPACSAPLWIIEDGPRCPHCGERAA
jgi:hypothetical protein